MSLLTYTARALKALAAGALRSIAGIIRRGITGLSGISWIQKAFAPLTKREAGSLYQTAKAYIQAGAQQTALQPTGIVNTADVPSIPPAGVPRGGLGTVEYDVRVPLVDPATGRRHWATVFVSSVHFLTFAEIAAEASAASQEVVNKSDPTHHWVSPIGYGPGGIQIAGVANFGVR
jgi:hypothetical protein